MWDENIERAKSARRELHKIPELSWQEEKTRGFIEDYLSDLNIQWRRCSKTGLVAQLAHGQKGQHVALRADMDGLGMVEENSFCYKSTVDECMHGCGHDGHMAVLLAVGGWLKIYEDTLSGPVSLIFQPAEEGGYGAREMIADGALKGVDKIFGWHNWPTIPFGKVVCEPGVVMAANGSFEITVHGSGGHASQPESCCDPVLAASAITMGLQQIVSRKIAPQQAAVVSVTSIDARSGETIIPGKALLKGSVRGISASAIISIGRMIEEVVSGIGRGYGVTAEVKFKQRYPPVVNTINEAEAMSDCFLQVIGNSCKDVARQVPLMASEDFSYYLGEVPGAFALVGAGDGGHHSVPCHNARYDFNDKLIEPMVRVMSLIVGAPLPEMC